MKRKQHDREHWEQESRYITGINPDAPGDNFHHNRKTFDLYVLMQARFAEEDGFPDIAKDMLAHVGYALGWTEVRE